MQGTALPHSTLISQLCPEVAARFHLRHDYFLVVGFSLWWGLLSLLDAGRGWCLRLLRSFLCCGRWFNVILLAGRHMKGHGKGRQSMLMRCIIFTTHNNLRRNFLNNIFANWIPLIPTELYKAVYRKCTTLHHTKLI